MNSSASAIADALVTMFSAASQFGPGNVAKDSFMIMETAAGSCLTVQWAALNRNPITFGTPMSGRMTWNFNLHCYIRDTGDPYAAMNRVWTATDNVLACLSADDTLQGTVDAIGTITGNHDAETAYSVGGATWLPFDINVEVILFP